ERSLVLFNQIQAALIYEPLQRVLLLPLILVFVLVKRAVPCAKICIRKSHTPSAFPGMAIRMRPADWFIASRILWDISLLHINLIFDTVNGNINGVIRYFYSTLLI